MKNLNGSKTIRLVLIMLCIISAIAILDILSMNSNIFGSPSDYLIGNFGVNWWGLFFKIGLIFIILSSIIYFLLKKDFSESISIFIGTMLLWMVFGVADLFFFLFQGKIPPSNLCWLQGGFLSILSNLVGFHTVTPLSLIISVLIGLIIVYFITKFLVEKI